MQALWLTDGVLRLAESARPTPAAGEARVRVQLAGICGTDLELVKGYYPYDGIPGHEFVGQVEAAPDAPEWVGRRVVGEINVACGTCAACRAERRTHCERRSVLGIKARHGAFAEALSLPLVNLHVVPDEMPDDVAVFTEPAAAALHVLEQVRPSAPERVVVIGCGRLGLLCAQALRSTGCALLIVGRSEAGLARARELGLEARPQAAAARGQADVVVECTGERSGFELARTLVRPRGTLVLKSTYHGRTEIDLSALVVDELTLMGSRCGPFAPALRALADGTLAVRGLIDARYALRDATLAFAHAARPGVLKVLIEPRP